MQKEQWPVIKYDYDHDVLHVYYNNRCNSYHSSADEIEKGVYRFIDDDTGDITGYKILDYQKKVEQREQERQTFFPDSEVDINYVYPWQV